VSFLRPYFLAGIKASRWKLFQESLISKPEYYSSLPWFRRCLAMLNWRPVADYELR